MTTKGKSQGRVPSLLLTLLLCFITALGLGAAAPVHAFTLGGNVVNDANGNGAIDAADTPLAGVPVSVQPAAGGVSATTTTGANGSYSFPGLAANSYTVTVGAVAGLLNGNPASATVTLTADRNDVNFLFVVPGLIGGKVVSDLNGNGIADPNEPGLAGVPVELRQVDSQGGITVVTTVLSGPDGTFTLPIQPAGSYLVIEHDPAAAVSTGANAGLSGTAAVVDPNTIQVVLNGAQSAIGLIFSDRTPQANGISGFVYNDTNNNNAIDPPADQPVPNAVVELRDAAQNLLASTLTDQTGGYFFGSVASGGTYVIRVLPPSGFLFRKAAPSSPATSTGTTGILIQGFNPSANYANNNFLLGPVPAVSPEGPGSGNAITGKVFNDLNGDGTVSGGEPGLAGATITLTSTTGAVFGSTTTGVTGEFSFVNLAVGDYNLTETDPPGFVSTGVQPGIGGTSLSLNTIRITVTGTNNLFSGHIFLDRSSTPSVNTGIISGSVLNDVNFNNTIDVADQPVAGVRIVLQTTGGGFLAQAFTDQSGNYSFTNLVAGTYQVVEVDPANFVSITASPGTGAFFINVNTLQVSLANGGVSAGNRFLDRGSVVSPTVGSISGTVFRDLNGNQQIDNGDLQLQGATIQLFTALNTFVGQTTSAANGTYSFPNLPPGTYFVTETNPAGFVSVNSFPGPNGTRLGPDVLQVVVAAGFDSGSNFFLDALTQPQTSTISGTVLRDLNGNGFIDNGDIPLSGVTVQLQTQGGGFLAQATTDLTGAYSFPGLAPGTYRVVEFVPAGLSPLSASSPSGIVLNSTTIQLTVAGGTFGGNNFLNTGSAPSAGPNTISGVAIRDTNLDGSPNGELGLAGMVITLRNSGSVVVGTAVTGVAGTFSFPGLASGTYTLTATPPSGLFNTNAIPGQNGTKLNAATIQVTTSFGVTNYPGHQFLAGP